MDVRLVDLPGTYSLDLADSEGGWMKRSLAATSPPGKLV